MCDTLNLKTNENFCWRRLNDILPANELGISSVFVKYGYGKLEGHRVTQRDDTNVRYNRTKELSVAGSISFSKKQINFI